jgi:hypothetical protein
VLRSGRCDGVAVKALFRRAKGFEGVGDLDGAMKDLKTVAEIQPHNRDALKEVSGQGMKPARGSDCTACEVVCHHPPIVGGPASRA